MLEIGGKKVMLCNLDGDVYALSGICTHEEFELSPDFVLAEYIVCPLHLSQFDIRNGDVLNPPATERLPTYKVKIEGGEIYVQVP